MGFRDYSTGDTVPWFTAATLDGNQNFVFDTTAGRYVLLLFVGSASHEASASALAQLPGWRRLFDDHRACFFGVTSDPSDAAAGRIARLLPGIRWFLDYDRTIARLYGAADEGNGFSPHWLLLDPRLRVLGKARIHEGEKLLRRLEALLEQPGIDEPAPVLVVPDIFDRDFCSRLIDYHEHQGGAPSGFMLDVDGVTTPVLNAAVKQRSDVLLTEGNPLRDEARLRLARVLMPQIRRAFQFEMTRVERYVVACYDSDGGGYFQPHRDNTTIGTAHRRFACSINLNAEDFEGGDLRFPEFGQRSYRPPTGGAVIFSCALLHEAMPVTRGKRYAFLPFLYDEQAALQREQAARGMGDDSALARYRA